ncbi:MAG: flagellar export chaperone FlgN [Clostridia bacterium]|nr:flagellar export chaperone FlgN [Clostridia bacterium]
MNGIMNDIFDTYKQEVEVLESFNQISKEKSKVVKKNDMKVLNSMIRTEEALLMKLACLEAKKQKALEIFRNENNIKDKVSMRTLKKHLDKNEIQRFDQLSKKFSQSLIEQEQYKTENEKLIENRLEYLDNLLIIIEKENSKYSKSDVLIDKKV